MDEKTSSESSALKLTGHCYCESVRFSVRIPDEAQPFFSVYCHCDSCRRSHAAPLYQVVCVEDTMFQIDQGEEHIQPFQKNGAKVVRNFCRKCGTRISNHFPTWKIQGKTPVVFFPNLLDSSFQRPFPEKIRPKKHSYSEECVLDTEKLRELWETK